MNERKYKTVATLSGVAIDDPIGRIFKMKNGLDHKSISSIEAADYRVGTRVTITLEEPEPPKEYVVLPEGMKWMLCNGIYLLYTADGAMIAQVIDAVGTVWPPFKCGEFAKYEGNTEDEAMKLVENALAEHGYFGARKVVENG